MMPVLRMATGLARTKAVERKNWIQQVSEMTTRSDRIAIWALTSRGAELGRRLQGHFPDSTLFTGQPAAETAGDVIRFKRLAEVLPTTFQQFGAHVFIMATGIVVRSLAGLLQHKTEDPAVVVLDECGQQAISLLSGHLGGANALARQIGMRIGARPVITTATDLQNVPAIDMIAQERDLTIENPGAIRHVSMALLERRSVHVHDPHGRLAGALPADSIRLPRGKDETEWWQDAGLSEPGVWVDDIRVDLPGEILVLRPPSLLVGVGCNRGTPADEIGDLLEHVLDRFGLSAASVAGMASIDLKADERGLLALARNLARPLTFFSRDQLATVPDIPSPSAVVEKHVGVQSVCEAAAILASGHGRLIVPKQTSPNVTIAIARKSFMSSE
jgi:cobalt-precorrin 5A hydrolase